MTAEIINLEAQRGLRDQPDGDQVRLDADGWPMYRYLADYQHAGQHFDLKLWAYDLADAEAQVLAMRDSLVLVGQVFARVDG